MFQSQISTQGGKPIDLESSRAVLSQRERNFSLTELETERLFDSIANRICIPTKIFEGRMVPQIRSATTQGDAFDSTALANLLDEGFGTSN